MSEPSSQFGPYTLLYSLGIGGMGQVFLARQSGEHGIQRLVALKRMLAQHLRNNKFKSMFLDEVRIAAQLNHGNIVQVIDHGVINEQQFMAMEYVHGENLLELLITLAEKDELMPLDLVLQVTSCVCQGLDNAHSKKSMDGKPLGIVHRDVSPQNILISFQGEVKIADFGVARAAEQTHQTLGGELKGKLSFMSPEQAYGKALDHRSDLFSLGVVLYEALSNRSPFARDNAMATLEAVRAAEAVSISRFRPDLPDEVVRFVHRALSRDVDGRPDSARAMYEELQQIMRLHNMVVSAFDLADYMSDMFPESRLQKSRGPGGLKTAVGRRADETAELERRTLFYLRRRHPAADAAQDGAADVGIHEEIDTGTIRPNARRGAILAVAILAAAAVVVALALVSITPWRGDATLARPDLGAAAAAPRAAGHDSTVALLPDAGRPRPRVQATLSVRTIPSDAVVTVDGRRLPGKTPLSARLEPGRRRLSVTLAGHRRWRGLVVLSRGHATTVNQRLEPLPGELAVRSTHECRVRINGKLVKQTPVDGYAVPPGAARVICLDAARGIREVRQVKIAPGARVAVAFRFGALSINLQPWARVTVNGKRRGTTPLRVLLPVGEHRVTMKNAERHLSRAQRVEISTSRTTHISSW